MNVPFKIDIGRVLMLPVFMLLLVINIVAAGREFTALETGGALRIVKAANSVVAVAYYALLVFLYAMRGSARSSARSLVTRSIAVIATFLPFMIPVLQKQSSQVSVLAAGICVTIAGLIFSLYSLGALGRSLSIIPQARSVVQTGPYRLVRHPLYLGELTAAFGMVIARSSLSTVIIFFLFAGALLYRAVQEEKLLSETFPEYQRYSANKCRLIPGVL